VLGVELKKPLFAEPSRQSLSSDWPLSALKLVGRKIFDPTVLIQEQRFTFLQCKCTMNAYDVHMCVYPQSRQSARLFLLSSELGPPQPSHPQVSVSPSPLVPGGETHSLAGEGVGGVPIRTRGQTLWYTTRRYTVYGRFTVQSRT
jgi:hypothetical protein